MGIPPPRVVKFTRSTFVIYPNDTFLIDMDLMKKAGILLISLGALLILGPLALFLFGWGGIVVGSVALILAWTPAVFLIGAGVWLLRKRSKIVYRKKLIEELPEPIYE
jgi:hypothetical protein